jgi:hypothetical protein
LKACGLFTAAIKKRNPYIAIRPISFAGSGSVPQVFGLVRHFPALVTSAQFVQQMLKMGRKARGFRAKVLLQPLSHSVADRSAGLAIDRLDVVSDSAVHDEFRFLVICLIRLTHTKSLRRNLFPLAGRLRALLVKFELKAGTVP